MNRRLATTGPIAALVIAAGALSSCATTPTPAPTPTAPETQDQPAETTATMAAEEPGLLPFNGGTYTWDNGISVTTKVELVEPWQQRKSEFGSITLTARDTKVILRYTVRVPKTYQGTVDATNCQGSFSVDNGNDDEAFTAYSDEETKDLTGRLRPGSTKYGLTTIGVKQSYARSAEFTYENSCGATPGDETAAGYWGGRIPANTTPQPASMFKRVKGPYFEVIVTAVRQYDDGYATHSQACLQREVPGVGSYVPSTIKPWTITVNGKQVKADTYDPRTTYDPDTTLAVPEDGDTFGSCNAGWIFYKTTGKPTKITYANSLGESTSWKI